VHVISRKKIREFHEEYGDLAKASLDNWYRIITKNNPGNFAELKSFFNGVDRVGKFYVFNIGGNHVRLISVIHFDVSRLYIRDILSHDKYDEDKWKA
jgi:mRNA interferase HigB